MVIERHEDQALDLGVRPSRTLPGEAQLSRSIKTSEPSSDEELDPRVFDVEPQPPTDTRFDFDVKAARWPGTHPVSEGFRIQPCVEHLLPWGWQKPLHSDTWSVGCAGTRVCHVEVPFRNRASRAFARRDQKTV
jgi:hypothetical protein